MKKLILSVFVLIAGSQLAFAEHVGDNAQCGTVPKKKITSDTQVKEKTKSVSEATVITTESSESSETHE